MGLFVFFFYGQSSLNVDRFRTNIRMTETFAKGRVFITGGVSVQETLAIGTNWDLDAAHIHSPTGGQVDTFPLNFGNVLTRARV